MTVKFTVKKFIAKSGNTCTALCAKFPNGKVEYLKFLTIDDSLKYLGISVEEYVTLGSTFEYELN